jgi:hypothetical protein
MRNVLMQKGKIWMLLWEDKLSKRLRSNFEEAYKRLCTGKPEDEQNGGKWLF